MISHDSALELQIHKRQLNRFLEILVYKFQVGFTGAFIDREGWALSAFGSRTTAAYEGKGVMGNPKSLMYDSIKTMYPDVTVETSDVFLGNHANTLIPGMITKGYKVEVKDVSYSVPLKNFN